MLLSTSTFTANLRSFEGVKNIIEKILKYPIIYYMLDSSFKLIGNRNNDGALNWIKFTIDIALNILNHRLASKKNYTEEKFHVNELITRELLGRNIWKFSEAYGKFRGCPFWSVKAFDHFSSMKKHNKTKAECEKNLRHEHVYPQVLLIKKLKNLKKLDVPQILEDLI